MYKDSGSYTWTKPSDIDETKPILVHVWGAGGGGCDGHNLGYRPDGGGGGGLAVKLIDPTALSATESITIGAGSRTYNGVGGSSSFGSHCSASGGNSGYNNSPNEGSGSIYGVGGLGLNGDVNRRGGTGGQGYYTTATNCGAGGGGSAPAPYGYKNGFAGGIGSTYAGGGGGGIGSVGTKGEYTGGGGGGSMNAQKKSGSPNSYFTMENGGNGLLGTGSTGGTQYYSFVTYGGSLSKQRESGKGPLNIGPNEIFVGGGGGTGTMFVIQSSGGTCAPAGHGGPGGGGGGVGTNADQSEYLDGGCGGFLGGGGGSGAYCMSPGDGGNAGGGGGTAYYSYRTSYPPDGSAAYYNIGGYGGDGVVIIQYARIYPKE